MHDPVPLDLAPVAGADPAGTEGCIAVFGTEGGSLDGLGRRVDRLTRGSLGRLASSPAWGKLKPGEMLWLHWPAGLAAEAVALVKLPKTADPLCARRAGARLAQGAAGRELTVLAGSRRDAADIGLGILLRTYDFNRHKSGEKEQLRGARLLVADPDRAAAAVARARALAAGVLWTRDLVNEPANVLTTTEFAARLGQLGALGVRVEVLDEAELERLGMRCLLAVGQGSASPSKVAVMEWRGGAAETPPLALVGKGVVFDTGGISIKPAAGMEEMTMDMGGAATVAGAMRALALRGARANVVGLVGLVENMPDGRAQRPGDILVSMKGDTVEVVNTDAEGRLVLADLLWYAQERFRPGRMVDLATLTGAIIVSLGHHQAGVFSNDDAFAGAFLKAADAEGEGAWRMPVAAEHDRQIKATFADIRNSAGREAGSCTAAAFLKRFVREGMPWVHLDIAGVARAKSGTDHAPKGATGWGVLALNRLVEDICEG